MSTNLKALLIAAVIASGLSAAPAAHAGDYHVYLCKHPNGKPVVAGRDWQLSPGVPAGSVATDSCGDAPATGIHVTLAGANQSARINDQSYAQVAVPGGSGLKIYAMRAERSVSLSPAASGSDTNAQPEYDLTAGGVSTAAPIGPPPPITTDALVEPRPITGRAGAGFTVVESCAFLQPCNSLAWPGRDAVSRNIAAAWGDGTDSISFVARCSGQDPGGCGASATFVRVDAWIWSVDLTVRDYVGPVVTGAAGAPTGTATQTGVEPLTFTATDTGAGVYQSIVRWDGKETQRISADAAASCQDAGVLPDSDLEFDTIRPCATRVDGKIDVDTRLVPDGTHRLQVVARDAGGNETAIVDRSVVVANAAVAPAQPTPTQGTVVAPGLGAPAGGVGTPFGAGAKFVTSRKSAAATATFGTKKTLAGKLVDAAGKGIANASIDVFETLRHAGAAPVRVALIITGPRGTYRYQPSTNASKTVRLGYGTAPGGGYVSTREVALAVAPKLTIAAQDRSVAPRSVIALSGTAKLDGLPAAARVEVQFLGAGGWSTIATTAVDVSGRWTYRRQLTKARNTTIPFRALMRPNADLASAKGTSRPVRVHVR